MSVPIFAVFSHVSFFMPTAAGIVRFKQLDRSIKVFVLFCIYSCIELSIEYVLGVKHINNTLLINYGFLIETLFPVVVCMLAVEERGVRRVIGALGILIVCIWVIDKIFFDVGNQINSEMGAVTRVFIIIVSLVTMHTIAKKLDSPLTDKPIFWVSAGFILYSAGTLFIVALSNVLLKMGYLYFLAAWYLNWSLTILSNLIFLKGFFCRANA